MSQQSTGLSKHEKKRPHLRGGPRGPAPKREPVAPLLYDRKRTAELLGGCSQSTLIALEEIGRLDPVKLHTSQNGKVYYRAEQVHALAAGE
jgi:hypothetical protein